jgi:predicted Fe-Mo cluster-binding NifX family protein
MMLQQCDVAALRMLQECNTYLRTLFNIGITASKSTGLKMPFRASHTSFSAKCTARAMRTKRTVFDVHAFCFSSISRKDAHVQDCERKFPAVTRIALPVDNGRILTVLDFADSLIVVDVEKGQIVGRCRMSFPRTMPPIRVRMLVDKGISTVLCGAVSGPLAIMLRHSGINVVAGLTGKADQIVQEYAGGRPFGSEFFLPGFCLGGGMHRGRFNRRRFRGGRGW